MTYILQVYNMAGDDYETKQFKTLRGATAAGCRELKALHGREFHGYLHADRFEGESPYRRHVVAEWKDRGRVLALVWS
jgi:hypothetical protein